MSPVCADSLPYSIRYLLESAIRNCDNFQVLKEDVEKIMDWEKTAPKQVEIPFKPARVILQVRKPLLLDLSLSHCHFLSFPCSPRLMVALLDLLEEHAFFDCVRNVYKRFQF